MTCFQILTSEVPADWALDAGQTTDPELQPLSPAEPRMEEALSDKPQKELIAEGSDVINGQPPAHQQVQHVHQPPARDGQEQQIHVSPTQMPVQDLRYRGTVAYVNHLALMHSLSFSFTSHWGPSTWKKITWFL